MLCNVSNALKRRYSGDWGEIALFDMSTVILHNTFKTSTLLIDATANDTS